MKKLAVILALFMSVNASAGLLLEPYVGYALGKRENADGTGKGDVTGLGYGGRIGWTLPLVFFAFDYSMGGFETKDKDSGIKFDTDHTAMALVAGVSLPVVRLWAGYLFDAEVEAKTGGSTVKFEGNGMKAGLGFKPVPFLPLSLNAEYIMTEYDKANGTTLATKRENKMFFISISAPFSL